MRNFFHLDPFPQPRLLRVNYPVVLMHGFGVIATLGRKGHLHGEAMHLRSRGVWAYAPNVPLYGTITDRAEVWRERVRVVLEETGASRIHLIAHSMGGLDARFLVSRLGGHQFAKTLTTVSTPHRGTSIASITLEQPSLLTKWLAHLADALGVAALGEMSDEAAGFLDALAELTPQAVCESFNPDVPDHPDVRYFSYTGWAGKGTDTAISPFLVPLNRILYSREGINDGFVTPESAAWGTVLGKVKADHAAQIGLHVPPAPAFDSHGFYGRIVEQLP